MDKVLERKGKRVSYFVIQFIRFRSKIMITIFGRLFLFCYNKIRHELLIIPVVTFMK
jgi:hypothetical protein